MDADTPTEGFPAGDDVDEAPERPTEARLARVHLRTGVLGLARAELESIAGAGTLDTEALADLAEVRWRTGDLPGAGEAAQAYLATGSESATTLAIAAEAAAALGRPGEARRLATRALAADGPIDAVFRGIARSAIWPDDGRVGEPAAELFPAPPPVGGVGAGAAGAITSRRTRRQPAAGGTGGAAAATVGAAAATAGGAAASAGGAPSTVGGPTALPWVAGAVAVDAAVSAAPAAAADGAAAGGMPATAPSAGSGSAAGPGLAAPAGVAAGAGATARAGSDVGSPAGLEAGLWDAHDIPVAPELLPDPAAELVAARASLAAGASDEAAVHLALALRLEPTMAPAILDAAGDHRSPALDLVRGDALRLVGHEAEARRAYASAARGMAGRSAEREA